MAETGSGIRVRPRRMEESYPGSRGLAMGGLKEDDDYCRLERLVGGVGWWPLWFIGGLYIWVYACCMRRDVGRRGRRKKTANWETEKIIKKERKKERKRSSERSHKTCCIRLICCCCCMEYFVSSCKCNAMQMKEKHTQTDRLGLRHS